MWQGQYSASRIDTPISGHVLTFSPQHDFLALSIELTLNDVIAVILDLDGDLTEHIIHSRLENSVMAPSDREMLCTVYRLLGTLDQSIQLHFMGKHIKREMIFHILCGSCGSQFLQSVISIQQAGEIYEVNSWIKENFRNSFTVEKLAEQKT